MLSQESSINLVFEDVQLDNRFDKKVPNGKLVKFKGLDDFEKVKQKKELKINIKYPGGNKILDYELLKSPKVGVRYTGDSVEYVNLDNFVVLASKEKKDGVYARLLLYDDGQIDGYIQDEKVKHHFTYLTNRAGNKYTLYSTGDENVTEGNYCGAVINPDTKPRSNKSTDSKLKVSTNICRDMNIALDADYEFYQTHGSNSWAKMISIISQASGHLDGNFNLSLSVSYVGVWTISNDPYSSTSSEQPGIINELNYYWPNYRQHVPRDFTFLFTGKTITNVANDEILGAAFVNHTCAGINNNFIYGWLRCKYSDVEVDQIVVHELGHHFGLSGNHTEGSQCGNTGIQTIMCPNHVNGNGIIFNSTEFNAFNSAIINSSCFTSPNIYPTVNGSAYAGTTTLCQYNSNLGLNNNSGNSYSWVVNPSSLSGNGSFTSYGSHAIVNVTGFYILQGKIFDRCGNSTSNFFYLNPCGGGYRVAAYPNAVSQTLYLKSEGNEINDLSVEDIVIYDGSNNQMEIIESIEQADKGLIQLRLRNRKPGIYYLKIKNNEAIRLYME